MTEHPKVRLTDLAANDQWPENEQVDDAYADLALFLAYVAGEYPWLEHEIARLRRAIWNRLSEAVSPPELHEPAPRTSRKPPAGQTASCSSSPGPETYVEHRAADQSPQRGHESSTPNHQDVS